MTRITQAVPQWIGRNGLIAVGLLGLAALGLTRFYLCRRKTVEKVQLMDIVGNTPLIYLPKLSKAAGSDIYVPLCSLRSSCNTSTLLEAVRTGPSEIF